MTNKHDEFAGRIRDPPDAALFQNKVDTSELRQLTGEAQQFLMEANRQLRRLALVNNRGAYIEGELAI